LIFLNIVHWLVRIVCIVKQYTAMKSSELLQTFLITSHLVWMDLLLNLKQSKVIPLYKKGNRDIPGNYRPISLLSIFDKIMEKLMYNRLYSYLVMNRCQSFPITELMVCWLTQDQTNIDAWQRQLFWRIRIVEAIPTDE